MTDQSHDTNGSDLDRDVATNCVAASWVFVCLGVALAMAQPESGQTGPVAMIFAGLTSSAIFSWRSVLELRQSANASGVLLHSGNLATIVCVATAFGLQMLAQHL